MTVAKGEAILFLVSCWEVNSTRLITSELANQRAQKALFTCVIYTKNGCWLSRKRGAGGWGGGEIGLSRISESM